MQAAQTEQIVQSAPQNAQTEETAQTAGSQYSMGTVGREAGQSGVDAGGLKNPVFQKFASVIYKNHGTEIVVANLMDGAKSAYDPRTNRLYISSKLGTGTAMREALVHELLHSVEGRGGYGSLQGGGDAGGLPRQQGPICSTTSSGFRKSTARFTSARGAR